MKRFGLNGLTIDKFQVWLQTERDGEKLHTRVFQYTEMTQSTQTNPWDGDPAKYQVSCKEYGVNLNSPKKYLYALMWP